MSVHTFRVITYWCISDITPCVDMFFTSSFISLVLQTHLWFVYAEEQQIVLKTLLRVESPSQDEIIYICLGQQLVDSIGRTRRGPAITYREFFHHQGTNQKVRLAQVLYFFYKYYYHPPYYHNQLHHSLLALHFFTITI